MTEAGKKSCHATTHFSFANEKYLLEVLSEREQQLFVQSLRKILNNVEPLNKLVAKGQFWD